jgi:glutathione S-transferase
MSKPVLHGFFGSPFTRTVGMLLIEKDVDFDHNKINVLAGGPREPDHLARNAFGKVPVLEHEGMMIYETAAILDYVDTFFRGPSFTPTNVKDKARMDMAVGIGGSFGAPTLVFGVAAYHLFPDFVGGQDEEKRQNGIVGGRLVLTEMMKLKGNSEYIAGDAPSLGDLYLIPQVTYLAATPDADAVWSDIPGFQEWWTKVKELKSYNPTDPTQIDPTA